MVEGAEAEVAGVLGPLAPVLLHQLLDRLACDRVQIEGQEVIAHAFSAQDTHACIQSQQSTHLHDVPVLVVGHEKLVQVPDADPGGQSLGVSEAGVDVPQLWVFVVVLG